jgi:DNA invertase Pin-like site-specific DNA recombinase
MITPDQPKRAAIYCRISDDREGRELGVQRQEEDCRAVAARMGYTVVEVYVDNDISASTRSKKPRPKYVKLIKDAKAGQFDVIIAYTSSRLTRKPREHEDLIDLAQDHGVQFAYVSSPSFDLNTSAGQMIARIMAAKDAGEAGDISERAQRQRAQNRATGTWSGGRRPYGYHSDGMTVLAEEAAEVLKASEAVLNGASLNGLVTDWNKRGLTTTAGNPWTGRSLRRTLMRARNAGLMGHVDKSQDKANTVETVVGPARWPVIVPEPLWRGVVAILSDPGRNVSPGPARRWRGTGLYLCHEHGSTIYVNATGGKNRQKYSSYTCSTSKHVARMALAVDDFVDRVVVKRLSQPDAIDLLRKPDGPDTAKLATEAVALRAQRDNLASLLMQGVLTEVGVRRESEKLRVQIESIEAQMADAVRGSALAGLVGVPDVKKAWDATPMDCQRVVIDELMTVTLLPSRKGRPPGWKPGDYYFDPETVDVQWKS